MVIIVVAQILLRALMAVVEIPMIDTVELAQYFLISIVFISAAYASRKGEHIAMLEFKEKLSERARFVLDLFLCGVATVIFALVFYSALLTIASNYRSVTPALGIPLPVFFFPTTFGFLLLTIEYFVKFLSLALGKSYRLTKVVLSYPEEE
jgi:TRAP-type C4-dicarboxylate transport system permease small subunit